MTNEDRAREIVRSFNGVPAEVLAVLPGMIAAALDAAEERGAVWMNIRIYEIILRNGWIGFWRTLREIEAIDPAAVCEERRVK